MEVRIDGHFSTNNNRNEIGIYIRTSKSFAGLYGKWCGNVLHILGGDVEHNYNILKEIKRR